jgi:hypothetical protein
MNSEQDSINTETKIFMKIQENKQIIVLNVLQDCKYTMILRLSWLRNVNSQINWATEEICLTDKAYNVVKQSEMCLSKHRAWITRYYSYQKKTCVKVIVQHKWRSTEDSQKIPWWESQVRIHKIIQVICRIFNSVCTQEEQSETVMH